MPRTEALTDPLHEPESGEDLIKWAIHVEKVMLEEDIAKVKFGAVTIEVRRFVSRRTVILRYFDELLSAASDYVSREASDTAKRRLEWAAQVYSDLLICEREQQEDFERRLHQWDLPVATRSGLGPVSVDFPCDPDDTSSTGEEGDPEPSDGGSGPQMDAEKSSEFYERPGRVEDAEVSP